MPALGVNMARKLMIYLVRHQGDDEFSRQDRLDTKTIQVTNLIWSQETYNSKNLISINRNIGILIGVNK
jgi:uncharacterized protein YdeI (BOF family)